MNLYSHAVLANHLLPLVRPACAEEFLWGAVAPDIRYLAGLRREATHLADEDTAGWNAMFPGCESFIQGYRVHLLLDRIDTLRAVSAAFPLNLLGRMQGKKLKPQQMAVVIELYYHKVFPNGLTLRGAHNPVLEGLGVRSELSVRYADALASYLAAPSFETAAASYARLGIIEDSRLEKYIRAYRDLERSRLKLPVLLASVKNAHLEKTAAAMYRALPE